MIDINISLSIVVTSTDVVSIVIFFSSQIVASLLFKSSSFILQ